MNRCADYESALIICAESEGEVLTGDSISPI